MIFASSIHQKWSRLNILSTKWWKNFTVVKMILLLQFFWSSCRYSKNDTNILWNLPLSLKFTKENKIKLHCNEMYCAKLSVNKKSNLAWFATQSRKIWNCHLFLTLTQWWNEKENFTAIFLRKWISSVQTTSISIPKACQIQYTNKIQYKIIYFTKD